MIDALRDPRRYPVEDFPQGTCRPPRLQLLETHISCVILAGIHAYKIKKPVDFGFLDFTTLATRRFYCEEEVRLNRRTAPTLYLDVVPINGSSQDPALSGAGPAIDYAVRMQRFPQDALLERMARAGSLETRVVEGLADVVAEFHLGLPCATSAESHATPAQVLAAALQNFDQIDTFRGRPDDELTSHLRHWTLNEHSALGQVFESRKRDGFVRECHGDLHLGNIVMLDGQPVPFDCIEFNAGFRWIDVISEVAFLVMDLREHGLHALATRFLNRYLERTGDYEGLRVLRFYIVYRAMVRAKVACIRQSQSETGKPANTPAVGEFARYVAFAAHAAGTKTGALVLMHGPSGSGKSTVAGAIAGLVQAIHVRSDVERKRLHGLAPQARTGSGLDAGIYDFAQTERTYARLGELARQAVRSGYTIIVDAAFLHSRHRQAFRRIAEEAGVPMAIVSCVAPRAVLFERVARRQAHGADASEAGPAVLERQLETLMPLTPDEARIVVEVDTAGSGDAVSRAASVLAGRLGLEHETGE